MKRTAPVVLALIALSAVLLAVLVSIDGEPTPSPPNTALPLTGCQLQGRVLDAAGAPLRGAAVRARILSPGTAYESPVVTTGEDGSFQVRLFPARGLWSILVSPPGRPGFTAGAPVRAEPSKRIRIEIREPTAAPAPPEPPNLSGEVHDSQGRLLTGIPVLVTKKDGEIVARAVSGERGAFALCVSATAPLLVRAESMRKGAYTVAELPCHDVELFVTTLEQKAGEMLVDFILAEAIENHPARIRLYDSLGQEELMVYRAVREGPHPLRGVLHGAYDIRVDVGEYAGAIQGFDFRPDQRLAEVPIARAASVRGALSTKAMALLFSRSPTWVPVSRTIRESDGIRGLYRGLWEQGAVEEKFSFSGLPAGDYRLRFLASGFETADREFCLAAGQALDLGEIELEKATGTLHLVITDRKDASGDLEYGYLVRLYETGGLSHSAEVGRGGTDDVWFRNLPAGRWQYRVERKLDGMSHTRYVGWDRPIPLLAGEERTVQVDCTWRFR